MTYPEWIAVFFLFVLLCVFAFAMLYQPDSEKARRLSELNAFGARAARIAHHRRRYFGQEAEAMDLRHVEGTGEPSLLALGQYPYSYLVHFGAVR